MCENNKKKKTMYNYCIRCGGELIQHDKRDDSSFVCSKCMLCFDKEWDAKNQVINLTVYQL